MCLAALHEAGKPVRGCQVIAYVLATKGLDADARVRAVIDNQIRQTLNRMEAKGLVRGIVSFPEGWWELAS